MPKSTASKNKRVSTSFSHAVERAEHLRLRAGLAAVTKAEGKERIEAAGAVILGSVDIDDDCRSAFPNHNRWDYVVGVARSNRQLAYFIEVHSAESSAVSKMEKKLRWLLEYLQRPKQTELQRLSREIHWVASGRVNIPKHVPQFKRLQTTLRPAGLQGPTTRLTLG
jgi:hypothetical protein